MTQKIITRAEAKARGLKRYFTGKPCKYGHTAEWITRMNRCCRCVAAQLTSATIRKCARLVCGAAFSAEYIGQKYCSPTHAKADKTEREAERAKAPENLAKVRQRRALERAKVVASKRNLCVVCGEKFPYRPGQGLQPITCSDAHQTLHRQKTAREWCAKPERKAARNARLREERAIERAERAPRLCVECGGAIESDARYVKTCSASCRKGRSKIYHKEYNSRPEHRSKERAPRAHGIGRSHPSTAAKTPGARPMTFEEPEVIETAMAAAFRAAGADRSVA